MSDIKQKLEALGLGITFGQATMGKATSIAGIRARIKNQIDNHIACHINGKKLSKNGKDFVPRRVTQPNAKKPGILFLKISYGMAGDIDFSGDGENIQFEESKEEEVLHQITKMIVDGEFDGALKKASDIAKQKRQEALKNKAPKS